MFGLGEGVYAGLGIPAGGITTYEDWNQFVKAVQTSSYETDVAQLTGMSALRPQSLEAQLRRVVETDDTFKLFKSLKRMPITSAVHEYNVQTSIGGQPAGMFNSELGPIASEVGEYERRVVFAKYLMTQAAISHVAAVQKTVPQLKALENLNALTRLARAANYASYYGDSQVAPMQFDGIYAQLKSFRNGAQILDMRGSSDVKELVDLIYTAYARVIGIGSFGKFTHVHLDPVAQVALDRYLDPAYRVVLDNNPRALDYGAPVAGIRTSFGHLYTEVDIWIENSTNAVPAYVRYGKAPDTAPGVPSVTAAGQLSVAGSRFGTDQAGTYHYVVCAIDERGVEGLPTTPVSATVAAGGAVELTITPNADRKQTGYAIYRSRKDAPNPNDLSDYRLVERIPANDDRTQPTVYVDKNERIPGRSELFLLNRVPESIQWLQLLPATEFPLYPTNAAIIPWAVLLYGALQLGIPQHHYVITNFIPPEAPWKPW